MQFLKDFNKLALAFDGKEYSFRDLLRHADDYSRICEPLIKTKNNTSIMGDRIALLFENRPEWAFVLYGVLKAGGVSVPIDFMSTPDEIRYILEDCSPVAVFASKKTEQLIRDAVALSSHKPVILMIEDIALSGGDTGPVFPDSEDGAVAVIIYTSGTTGSPKGVMLTYGNLWAIVECLGTDKYGKLGIMYAPDETYIGILPFHHIYPLFGTLMGPLACGSAVCMVKELSADAIFTACQTYKVTRMLGVPRLYAMFHKGIMSQIEKSAVAKALLALTRTVKSRQFAHIIFGAVQKKFGGNIRALMCGGSKIDVKIAQDFAALGFRLLEGYGMTETAPSMTMCDLKRFKHGSVGYVLPCGQVKIIHDEFCYKGPNVMKGYYNRPAETAAMFDADGWFHTGDKASIDRAGFIQITGRIKEIIILPNGKNINPEEMENDLLRAFPLIKDVGIIDRDGILFAVIHPDFAKIKSDKIINIKETFKWEVVDKYNLKAAHHKKIMDFAIVETELPRTRVGKLKRFALREMISQNQAPKAEVKAPDFEEYFLFKETIEDMLCIAVGPGDHFELDLNMDSLDRVELQVRVEGNFGIKLTNEDISHYPRICDMAAYIRSARTKMESEKTDWSAILKNAEKVPVPKHSFMMTLLILVTKPLFLFYFRIHKTGLANIPQNGPVIFAPNHQSYLDGLVLSTLLSGKIRRKTFFFAKDRNFKSWFRRFFAGNANIVLMNINRDLKATIQGMASIARQGNNIVIFPEGARTRDGNIMKFKKTFAIISKELDIPVVPVVLEGSFELFSIKNRIPRPGNIRVKFLEPIYPKDKDYEAIVEKTYSGITSSFKKD